MKKTNKLKYPKYVVYKPQKKTKIKGTNHLAPTHFILLYLDSKIPYGKYKNRVIEEIMDEDSSYWSWFSNNHKGGICYRYK